MINVCLEACLIASAHVFLRSLTMNTSGDFRALLLKDNQNIASLVVESYEYEPQIIKY